MKESSHPIGWVTMRAKGICSAPPEVVYATLADLQTHLIWAGERQGKKVGVRSLEAAAGAATVGTEFRSTGVETSGTFDDRSIVTAAEPPSRFEFTTYSNFTWKKGRKSTAETHHRYTITPNGAGSTVEYLFRGTGLRPWPLPLRIMLGPRWLRRIMFIPSEKGEIAKGLRNLLQVADERVRQP